MYKDFQDDVRKFNQMYELECNSSVTNLGLDQFKCFQKIIQEEIEEGDAIASNFDADPREALVNMADWLGDIIVYCSTQARRCGIDLEQVVQAIMKSNFSKLDAHGNPIKDERGKVMKGPNFVPPEPKIRAILFNE